MGADGLVLGFQPLEIGDRAIGAAAREHPVPPRTQRTVGRRLNIETGIKIGRATFPPQQRPHTAAIIEHQIDSAPRGDRCRSQLGNPDAFRPLMLFPFDAGRRRRQLRAGIGPVARLPIVRHGRHSLPHHRHADDDALLDRHLRHLHHGSTRVPPESTGHSLRRESRRGGQQQERQQSHDHPFRVFGAERRAVA